MAMSNPRLLCLLTTATLLASLGVPSIQADDGTPVLKGIAIGDYGVAWLYYDEGVGTAWVEWHLAAGEPLDPSLGPPQIAAVPHIQIQTYLTQGEYIIGCFSSTITLDQKVGSAMLENDCEHLVGEPHAKKFEYGHYTWFFNANYFSEKTWAQPTNDDSGATAEQGSWHWKEFGPAMLDAYDDYVICTDGLFLYMQMANGDWVEVLLDCIDLIIEHTAGEIPGWGAPITRGLQAVTGLYHTDAPIATVSCTTPGVECELWNPMRVTDLVEDVQSVTLGMGERYRQEAFDYIATGHRVMSQGSLPDDGARAVAKTCDVPETDASGLVPAVVGTFCLVLDAEEAEDPILCQAEDQNFDTVWIEVSKDGALGKDDVGLDDGALLAEGPNSVWFQPRGAGTYAVHQYASMFNWDTFEAAFGSEGSGICFVTETFG